ncbi:MAG: 4'-phosphopantetheinyl transferase superfamily protein [Bacteroidetes bacterium]|nr:4'-phosphopantetheinyl transferase superfamily protein [Bacteroidota bacterium]
MATGGPRSLVTFCHGPETAVVATDLPAFTPPPPGSIDAWYAPLARLLPHLDRFAALLDPVENDRAERFRFAHDRERFILGHGLLRELLGRYLKRDGSLVRTARGPFGKPYLERKDLRFNLSDTKDAVLVAFTTKQEVGADIETMTREVDHHAVSTHYFTPTEVHSIAEAGDGKRRFLELWTRKEAVLKASGVGIMDDLKALRVDAPRNTMVIAHEAFARMAAPEYHVHTYQVGTDHLISLASPVPLARLSLRDAAVV